MRKMLAGSLLLLAAVVGCGSNSTVSKPGTPSKSKQKRKAAGKQQAALTNSSTATKEKKNMNDPAPSKADNASKPTEALATFGGGCFWCVEAVFEELNGVISVESGYSGGHVENPTYQQIGTKTTGHAEVCRIKYDPTKISFKDLLEVFWKTHDPTTPNQQGADVGPQYRSVIFYHDDTQKELAEKYKDELNKAGAFSKPVVTEISKLKNYYTAEAYHQDYFRLNPFQGYCRAVINPKIEKFRKVFKDKLKTEDP